MARVGKVWTIHSVGDHAHGTAFQRGFAIDDVTRAPWGMSWILADLSFFRHRSVVKGQGMLARTFNYVRFSPCQKPLAGR